MDMADKLQVVHFIRKNRIDGNFSLEFIFEDIRKRLSDKVDFRVVYAKRFSNGVGKRILNLLDAYREQGQINHVTGDIHYVNYLFKKKKTILTILDCGFMNSKGILKRLILKICWLDLPVMKSKYITAISEATKLDIIKYTNCFPDKIVVIPVAVSEIFKPVPKKFNSECPVILQLGTAINKNLERLIPALENINCHLTIIGRLTQQQQQILKDAKIAFSNFVHITPKEVYAHYIKADIVTLISTYEGFGMPIIEANCVERVIITGNNTSMPEVGGDAACYVNPFSIEDIRNGINRIIGDPHYRDQLIEFGKKNKLRFSGEAIAVMYYNLYQKIQLENDL